MTEHDYSDIIRNIKHDFMVFRNGMTADTLRKAGAPYSIIFGLQLPQLNEIARKLDQSIELAQKLWADKNVRESRLLATWLFPLNQLSEDEAFELASSVMTREEADILSFRLLKKLPYANALAARLKESKGELQRYCGIALQRNLDA